MSYGSYCCWLDLEKDFAKALREYPDDIPVVLYPIALKLTNNPEWGRDLIQQFRNLNIIEMIDEAGRHFVEKRFVIYHNVLEEVGLA